MENLTKDKKTNKVPFIMLISLTIYSQCEVSKLKFSFCTTEHNDTVKFSGQIKHHHSIVQKVTVVGIGLSMNVKMV